MVSDAAKRKAAAKKAAAASKRAGGSSPAESSQSNSTATDRRQVADGSVAVLLPASLTARQRAALHEAAEIAGLQHISTGEGDARRMQLGAQGAGSSEVLSYPAEKVFTDAELADELQKKLNLDASRELGLNHGVNGGDAGRKGAERVDVRRRKTTAASHSLDPIAWVASVSPLLQLERDAEVEEARRSISSISSPDAASSSSRVMLNLKCTEVEGGLLGRSLITLVSNRCLQGSTVAPLPPHKFSPHDIVAIRPNKGDTAGEALVEGVVYRVKDTAIVIAVEEVPDDGLDAPVRLEKLANEVTYKRYNETLQCLGGGVATLGESSRIVDVLFGKTEPIINEKVPQWTPINKGLDDSQKRAVSLVLAAQDVSLIHGPPGTGKTTSVIEVILQEVKRGSRVLVAAASNLAVDNIVERLSSTKVKVVRMGHPARLMPAVLGASLEAQVLRSDNSALARECRQDIKKTTQAMMKLGRKEYQERRTLRQELRLLLKEERQRQAKAVAEVIKNSQVVCSTLTGVQTRDLRNERFDLAVIDEAAQALEVATWAAILKAKRAVLAGDHLQLPPTIISKKAESQGLGRTLFQRLQEMYGDSISEMLTVQYRMNRGIMQWSSDEFYDSKLTAAPAVAAHTLADLQPSAAELPVLMTIDTTGCNCDEQVENEGDSKANEGEARIVMAHATKLVDMGIPTTAIGIITPYNGQVALLKNMRPEALAAIEISSVDGFQGREKEALIISAVRSNSAGEIGFLCDQRRMNVAVTRARRHCCLICCTETLQSDPFLQRLTEYFENNGEYYSGESL